ncbi:MAG: SH3 domain-containing protein [Pirellulales bacterium]|nr:SH3 domain-containing protein [Pirellulales bacterium]
MRRSIIPFVFVCAACLPVGLDCTEATVNAAEQTFPYKAYISADDVYVRSGPGRNYYPTDKLRAGQAVEVYRHDPGGWYAIRPPKGSFTWVSQRFVRRGGDGLAEVTGKEVAARVGSRFSDIRDVIQVRLKEGEIIEPLPSNDMPSAAMNPSAAKWLKIAPPSGEFRWVHARFVDPNYPKNGIRKAPPGNSPLVQQSSATVVSSKRPTQHAVVDQADRPQSQPVASTTARGVISPEEFQKRIENAELELSVMVAEEPTVWQFDELITEVQSLLNRSETAPQRGKARILLAKIDRFASIKQRHIAVNTLWENTQNRNQYLSDLRRQNESHRPPVDGRFDGQGRLTRVVSPKRGAPRYALVDDAGDIQCYVTPAPGVNLRHYEQRLIGVNGSRGYVPEQRAPHIMAKHVDVLEEAPTKIR